VDASKRTEDFDLTGGTGTVRVVVPARATGLLVDGQPIALSWDDGGGSVGQLLARAGTADLSARLRDLRRLADGHVDDERSLHEQLHPLLRLFDDGRYTITLRRLAGTWELVDDRDHRGVTSFYPFDTYVLTQRRDALDAERVATFTRRIAAGEQPIAFCAGAADAEFAFVVDGHHKLAAYDALGVGPRVVEVRRHAPAPLTDDVDRAFPGER
jgi:hypothetical protein